MYVCLCLGVTDHDIRETIAEGASSVEEVSYCTGAGTRCGSCRSTIAALVEGEADEREDEPESKGRRCLRVLTSAA